MKRDRKKQIHFFVWALFFSLLVESYHAIGDSGLDDPHEADDYPTEAPAQDLIVALDHSVNDNRGILHNASIKSDGGPSHLEFPNSGYLSLDGNRSYVAMGNGAVSHLTSGFTVSLWFKSDDLTGIRHLAGSSASRSANGWRVVTKGAGLRFTTIGVQDYDTTDITLQASVWYQLTVVFTKDFDVKFYIHDGGASQTQVVSGTDMKRPAMVDHDDMFLVGASETNVETNTKPKNLAHAEYFSGGIDDLRVYNRELANSEIQRLLQGQISSYYGLIGYWKFNGETDTLETGTGVESSVGSLSPLAGPVFEANIFDQVDLDQLDWSVQGTPSLTKVMDGSSYNNTGILHGGASIQTESPLDFGFPNSGYLSLSGDTPYVAMNNGVVNRLTSNFTISLWFKSDDLTGIRHLAGSGGAQSENGWRVTTNGTGLRFTTLGLKDYDAAPITLKTSVWYQLVIVFTSDYVVKFHIRELREGGDIIGMKAIPGDHPARVDNDDKFLVGAYRPDLGSEDANSEQFLGEIDELRIYNRELLPSEIMPIDGAKDSSPDSIQGLVGYWDFDSDRSIDVTVEKEGLNFPVKRFIGEQVYESSSSFEDLPGDLTKKSASFEFWIKPSEIPSEGDHVIFETGGYIDGLVVMIHPQGLGLRVTTGTTVKEEFYVPAQIATDEYTHVVAMVEMKEGGGALSLSINGEVHKKDSGAVRSGLTDWTGSSGSTLGGLPTTGSGLSGYAGSFEGEIAQFNFYGSHLSDQDILFLYSESMRRRPELLSPTQLIGYSAPFESTSDKWRETYSLNSSFDFELSSTGVEWVETEDGFYLDHAYRFEDGRGVAPSFEDLPGDPSKRSASFEFWIKPNVIPTDGDHVIFETGGHTNGLSVLINKDGLGLIVNTAFQPHKSGYFQEAFKVSASIPTDRYTHVVAMVEMEEGGATLSLSINGTVHIDPEGVRSGITDWAGHSGSTLGGVPVDPNLDLSQEINHTYAGGFEGEIAQFNFYDKKLSPNQVRGLYLTNYHRVLLPRIEDDLSWEAHSGTSPQRVYETPLDVLEVMMKRQKMPLGSAFLSLNVRTLRDLMAFKPNRSFLQALVNAAELWSLSEDDYYYSLHPEKKPISPRSLTVEEKLVRFLNSFYDSLGYLEIEALDSPESDQNRELHFREFPSITAYYSIAREMYAGKYPDVLELDNVLYDGPNVVPSDFQQAVRVKWLKLPGPENFPNADNRRAYEELQKVFHQSWDEFSYEYDIDTGRVTNLEDHPLLRAAREAEAYEREVSVRWLGDPNDLSYKGMDNSYAHEWIEKFNQQLICDMSTLSDRNKLPGEPGEEKSALSWFGRIVGDIISLGLAEVVRDLVSSSQRYSRHHEEWDWEMSQLRIRERYPDIPYNSKVLNITHLAGDSFALATLFFSVPTTDVDIIVMDTASALKWLSASAMNKISSVLGRNIASGLSSTLRISSEAAYLELPEAQFGSYTYRYIESDVLGERLPVVLGTDGQYEITIRKVGAAGEENLFRYDPDTNILGERLVKGTDGKYGAVPRMLGGGVNFSCMSAAEDHVPMLNTRMITSAKLSDNPAYRALREMVNLDQLDIAGDVSPTEVSVLPYDQKAILGDVLAENEKWLSARDLFVTPNDDFPKPFYDCEKRAIRIANGLFKENNIRTKSIIAEWFRKGTDMKVVIEAEGDEWHFHVAPILKIGNESGTGSEWYVLDPTFFEDGVVSLSEWKDRFEFDEVLVGGKLTEVEVRFNEFIPNSLEYND